MVADEPGSVTFVGIGFSDRGVVQNEDNGFAKDLAFEALDHGQDSGVGIIERGIWISGRGAGEGVVVKESYVGIRGRRGEATRSSSVGRRELSIVKVELRRVA
ncbi:hypothetical protein MA16_Dca028715 [Dendrobium catenatum]|uniref:Uncharacterized protein n=1 Tax=Dendrobium catenatum TaxID=906689 RepID=A0A2I0VEH6_9ASPA|nr:hypothetical protein MA16_Dca028715 [Dendrobium catenatum]